MGWVVAAVTGFISLVGIVANKGTRDELKNEKAKNAKLTEELNSKKSHKRK